MSVPLPLTPRQKSLAAHNLDLARVALNTDGLRSLAKRFDRDEALELAYLGLVLAVTSYDPDKGALARWAAWGVFNTLLAAHRRQRNQRRAERDVARERTRAYRRAAPPGEPAADREDFWQWALSCLECPVDRAILQGRLDGFRLREIGAWLDMTDETVRQRERRIVARLRDRSVHGKEAGHA